MEKSVQIYYFFSRSLFDKVTSIFKYYFIKHDGEEKFFIIVRKVTKKFAKKSKSHFENKHSPCQTSIK